ncbi:hypothetical protein L798_02869 [Zootermopsis nevadensis]|uniref:Secreted protein n=1 Tax=Zootermopsis nevadensis TaxID=136037 RepID=A0A067QTM7_ZOONE|nr:hypothetical protein L798_02869 [Zootermopsis nevadensis]
MPHFTYSMLSLLLSSKVYTYEHGVYPQLPLTQLCQYKILNNPMPTEYVMFPARVGDTNMTSYRQAFLKFLLLGLPKTAGITGTARNISLPGHPKIKLVLKL